MPYLAIDGTFDLDSGAGSPSADQVLSFLGLPLLALLFVLLLRHAIRVARHPDCPPVWTWLFLAPAALCPLGWGLGVRKALPDGPFHDAVAVLIGLATLAGLAAGVWWCAVTRDQSYEPIPVSWQR